MTPDASSLNSLKKATRKKARINIHFPNILSMEVPRPRGGKVIFLRGKRGN